MFMVVLVLAVITRDSAAAGAALRTTARLPRLLDFRYFFQSAINGSIT